MTNEPSLPVIAKYLASCGVASRRAAVELVKAGKIAVNGSVVTDPSLRIKNDDKVTVDGKSVVPESVKRYIMLHKPRGYVTTLSDEKGRPDAASLARASLTEVESVVRPCGLYRMKSRDIVAMAQALEKTGIPQTLEGFLALPGVGRKIANLLMGELYDAPGVVVADTHCIRLANRLGFVENTKDPVKVEFALRKIVPPEESMRFCHALVHHGRECCDARKPLCASCFLNDLCKENLKKEP